MSSSRVIKQSRTPAELVKLASNSYDNAHLAWQEGDFRREKQFLAISQMAAGKLQELGYCKIAAVYYEELERVLPEDYEDACFQAYGHSMSEEDVRLSSDDIPF